LIELLPLHHLVNRANQAAWNARQVKLADDFVPVMLPRPQAYCFVDLCVDRYSRACFQQFHVVPECVAIDDVDEFAPVACADNADGDPAVLRRIDVEGRETHNSVSLAGAQSQALVTVYGLIEDKREKTIRHRYIDRLSLAGSFAVQQGRKNSLRCKNSR